MSKLVENTDKRWKQESQLILKEIQTATKKKKKKGKNASSNEIFTYRIGQDLSMVIPHISEGRGK